MKAKKLIENLPIRVKASALHTLTISGIAIDSRKVVPKNLFVALKGEKYDGAQFIAQAIDAGASAILTDLFDPFCKTAQFIAEDPKKLLPILAARFFSHPSQTLCTIGITGSKGKTTTSYLVRHLLSELGMLSGLIGGIEAILPNAKIPSALTTHDCVYNQKLLREMLKEGCKGAILEVSSHGIEQQRVEGIDFSWAIFTNLFPDHLDYHRTIEDYAFSKKKLLQGAKGAILNADSPWSSFMGEGFSYGVKKGDICAKDIRFFPDHSEFSIEGVPFFSQLIGEANIYNALAATALCYRMGFPLRKIAKALSSFVKVPGRMERIGNVFVDFAHTGQALSSALQALRSIAKGRIIVVFGCGGERDPKRRFFMAKAAEEGAQLSIITTDNPRGEDPGKIAEEISSFFEKRPLIELDREKAIEKALRMAGPDDLVLIAGKGHETTQIFSHKTVPFDDREVVKRLLMANARRTPSGTFRYQF